MKTRNLRQHPLGIRSVVIFANPHKKEAVKETTRLKSWLTRRHIKTLSIKALSKADAIVTLGGDGTILSVAPEAAQKGIPVLGINMGQLGFLTAASFKKMYQSLDRWLGGSWTESQRSLIEVAIPGIKKPQLALNDAVVRLKHSNHVIQISASINSEKLTQFVGDGVIIASTTGSTAYSLSAQGPVVHPDVDAMILTPICSHSLLQKPVVFPSHYTLELQLKSERHKNEVHLSLDGGRQFSVKVGDRIRVRRSPYKLKLVQDPRVSYFGVIREKLHWGGR